jgi:glycyl-tRNA synthetase beta chain
MTRMVGEFPELQGMMGYYYAEAEGLDDDVAVALRDYYHPRFAEDTLPETQIGQILALAERIDTLVGIFAIGHKPTGDKDPYGLRRAALGIVRILVEKQLDLDLRTLIKKAVGLLPESISQASNNILFINECIYFFQQRQEAHALSQGLAPDTIKAILYPNDIYSNDEMLNQPYIIYDMVLRGQALHQFRKQPECSRLAEANKRVWNILRDRADKDGTDYRRPKHTEIAVTQFNQDEEKNLYHVLMDVREHLTKHEEQHHYLEALMSLMPLCEPIDSFFDKVMVNVDDEKTRNNRLALLHALRQTLQHVADLSQLQS